MSNPSVVVVGGGAAGFFAAITCAEAAPETKVILLEKGPRFLSKVRISGGGRCNVTHACFDPLGLSSYYPRGGAALVGPFRRFQAQDTVDWFERRGVKLKTEADGRMFPVTDTSETIIDCLLQAAQSARVELVLNAAVDGISRNGSGNGFEVQTGSKRIRCDRLMLATGGCRSAAAGQLAVSLGHTLAAPVPSLFTFHVAVPWLRNLAGISLREAEVAVVGGSGLRERGALLITHAGLSGPVILKLSAWGARTLHAWNYRFPIRINWLAESTAEGLLKKLEAQRASQPARRVINTPLQPLAARLWEALVLAANIVPETRWAELSRSARHQLIQQLTGSEFEVSGKTLNQDEFVTCGGIPLAEVSFKTMESRVCPGLYFGGELLDIDGLTGGFNFQSAWTTGWIAGNAMAGNL